MIQGVEHSLQDDGSQKNTMEEQEEQEELAGQEQQDAQIGEEGKAGEEASTGSRVIYIRALMRGLDSALLPFALLKHDPFVAVRDYLVGHQQREYEAGLAEENRGIAALAHMRNAWNSVFRELRSDQIFFLCAWSSLPDASMNVVRASGLSFVIATPGVQRWLVTRPVWRRNELVAWCESIDTLALPRNVLPEIVLSEQNMLRLKPSLFFREQREESEGHPDRL